MDAGATKSLVIASDPVAAGRALEASLPQKARELLGVHDGSAHCVFLEARIAAELGEHSKAVKLLTALKPDSERIDALRVEQLTGSMVEAGKLEEGLALLDERLGNENLTPGAKSRLNARKGEWLSKAKKNIEAAAAYRAALQGAGGARLERLQLRLAEQVALGGDEKEKKEMEEVLNGLMKKGSTKGIMVGARRKLEMMGAKVRLTPKERVALVERLISKRAWNEADRVLKPLLSYKGFFGVEAKWLEARLLFKRRRHYAQAVEALDKIIAGKGAHSVEAVLLRARALSRMDRDEEAIKGYRTFAKKTDQVGREMEALFLASRLEFYLGHHGKAVASAEELVGNGRRKKKVKGLGPGRIRDAHFIAGMSAVLDEEYKRAQPHLKAASKGSKSAEAIERNKYWLAVARFMEKPKTGKTLLEKICTEDPTGWYAANAAKRLEEAGIPLGECELVKTLQTAEEEKPASPDGGVDEEEKVLPLETLSQSAAFLARAGLFKEAAKELRSAEEEGGVEASARDWIEHYNRLDAPQHAIRRAAIGLPWPPDSNEMWRARAAYPTPYIELVREVEEKHGLPSELVFAIARKESLFDPHAISYAGALGMMQMMPHTYETNRKRAGLEPLKEGEVPGPRDSIQAAACELAFLLEKFGGSIPLAVMAYNGGAAAVSRWLERSGGVPMDVFVEKAGFGQTRNYVRRVHKILTRYRLLEGLAPPDLPREASVAQDDKEDAGPGEDPDAGSV